MKLIEAFAIFAFILCTAANAHAAAASADKPNIVYVLADDLGYGDVHILNPERGKIATPNIDRLAKEGMAFTDAHGGSSVCTPTRYGILTGRYAWRTRLQKGVLDGYVQPLIAGDRLTVPALLKKQGYYTACIGKWHLGYTIDGAGKDGGKKQGKGAGAPLGATTADGPLTRGFDTFFGFHHARMIRSFFTNDRVTEMVEPVDVLPRITQRAMEYVAERAKTNQPFFLYFALNAPHTPIVPSKEWRGKSGLGDYGDYVMETDWAVGQVLEAIEKAGIAGKTLVVFTSDNGCSPAAGTAKLEKLGHFASGEFRGYKSDIWDGGHHIPLMVRWPGKVAAGSRCAKLVCLTDLMATCAELLGETLPPNAGEDSVSILPLLMGKDVTPRQTVIHHSISGQFAIRDGQWKLELCAGSGDWGKPGDADASRQRLPPVQLYDLSSDIGEKNNVQAEHKDVVQRLTALLEKAVTEGRSTPGPKQSNDAAVQIHKKEEAAPAE